MGRERRRLDGKEDEKNGKRPDGAARYPLRLSSRLVLPPSRSVDKRGDAAVVGSKAKEGGSKGERKEGAERMRLERCVFRHPILGCSVVDVRDPPTSKLAQRAKSAMRAEEGEQIGETMGTSDSRREGFVAGLERQETAHPAKQRSPAMSGKTTFARRGGRGQPATTRRQRHLPRLKAA